MNGGLGCVWRCGGSGGVWRGWRYVEVGVEVCGDNSIMRVVSENHR